MGTILKNSDWENKTQVKKGNIGEQIVQDFLESKGFVCYRPVTDKAHAFDFLAIKDKKTVIAAEVKSKSLMNKYKATGFNKRNWEDYMRFSEKHNVQIFIFFVDEDKKEVYGNWLSKLEETCVVDNVVFPADIECRNGTVIRIYPYEKMRIIAQIDDTTAEKLKEYSTRTYEYRSINELRQAQTALPEGGFSFS